MRWWKGGRNQGRTVRVDLGKALAAQQFDPNQNATPVVSGGGNYTSLTSGAAAAMAQAQAQAALMRQALGMGIAPTQARHPSYDDTFGWRSWDWRIAERKLISPHMSTVWNGPELRCEVWNESSVVRGEAGIHALFVPEAWETKTGPSDGHAGAARVEFDHLLGDDGNMIPTPIAKIAVTGIVERFGKYVLGTDGWRAEWVMIRKLKAPTDEIGLALEESFPDVEVVYGNR